MTRRAHVDLNAELAAATAWLLAEAEKPEGLYGRPYFSATDLENRVRSSLAERAHSKPAGAYGLNGGWWSGLRLRGLNGQTLLDVCRGHLFTEVRRGRLRADSPSGKHTCTGLRFRRAGAPLTAAEARTAAAKGRGPVVHYDAGYPDGSEDSWRHEKAPACLAGRPAKPRSIYAMRRPSLRKLVCVTSKPDGVTCAHCRRLLARAAAGEGVAS